MTQEELIEYIIKKLETGNVFWLDDPIIIVPNKHNKRKAIIKNKNEELQFTIEIILDLNSDEKLFKLSISFE